ncbi:hypothetical protein Tco_1127590, partial [Tanacetum coccineum]
FAIHGLCIDDSLVINARCRADSFVVFRSVVLSVSSPNESRVFPPNAEYVKMND